MFNLPKPKKKYEVITCGLDKAFQFYEYLYIDNDWMLINLITLNLKYNEVAYHYLKECEKSQSLIPLYKEILEDEQRRCNRCN